jgi:hypothetical protein
MSPSVPPRPRCCASVRSRPDGILSVTLTIALFLLLTPALSAQPTQRRVFVTGADGSGAPVVDLRAEDFQVVENGEERKILRVARAAAPMRIALVVDSSNAMASLLNNLRAGLRTFLDELPGEHEISFITTGGQIRIRQAPTADRQKLKTAAGLLASDGGGNSLIETMMETERRFLNAAPGQWPMLVIVTTDNGGTTSEPNYDRFNRFVSSFVERGGTAHAIVLEGRAGGITTEFVINVVKNTGGYYESMTIANVLPDKMRNLAAHIDANYRAMANWYELEYIGDGRAQARVQVGMKRPNVILQMSTRRPF